jgi:hypothetical protein
LDAESPTAACPRCGDTHRTTHVSDIDEAIGIDDAVGLAITYSGSRPWQEQWRQVLHDLDELERSYSGREDGPADSNQWRQIPIEFCEDTYHLKDWLKSDPAVPSATQGAVESYAQSSQSIRLAGDVANTNKHRVRKPKEREARIETVDLQLGTSRKATFSIRWNAPDGTSGAEDALVLAHGTIADWRTFFKQHQLAEG